ncbi:MAG: hypothetical protein CSH36_00920 [Thalassolituus sp.]|nr:MAG: hypothetical protein CSH36_00920 [Thalassolituus sp.]
MNLLTPYLQNPTHPATGSLDWIWLPGWSYQASLFTPIMDALPGQHWAVDYRGEASLHAAASALADRAPRNAIWCGWSLGGALAHLAYAAADGRALITLATGSSFLQQAAQSAGMPMDTFRAFSTSFSNQPDKTLKRFTALTTQGSQTARALSRHLNGHQCTPDAHLTKTLDWLSYSALPDVNSGQVHHLYSQSDALNPARFANGHISPAGSHAFFLEDAGQNHLLNVLRSVCQNTGATYDRT